MTGRQKDKEWTHLEREQAPRVRACYPRSATYWPFYLNHPEVRRANSHRGPVAHASGSDGVSSLTLPARTSALDTLFALG
jgi:hypothetical protein